MPIGGAIGKEGSPSLVRLQALTGRLCISHDRTVLLCGRDGAITDSHSGLFLCETRLLSRLSWCVNGETYPLEASPVQQNASVVYAVALPKRLDRRYSGGAKRARDASEETIELQLTSVVSDGLHQDAVIRNYARAEQTVNVEIEVDADFADYDEVVQQQRSQQGKLTRKRGLTRGEAWAEWRYRAHHRHRGRERRIDWTARLQLRGIPGTARWRRNGLRMEVDLAPGAELRICLRLGGRIDGRQLWPQSGCQALGDAADWAESTKVATRHDRRPLLSAALHQARTDLAALRLSDLDREGGWVPAAGAPGYLALFGRDILTAGWQAAMLGPEPMRGALAILRETQGRTDDAWRDERPGRILHEAHPGPTSALGCRPQGRYYGSFDASPFFVVVLLELYHWTGDRELVRRYLPAAEAALGWMERYGKPASKHFYGYRTRSKQGVKNQGWKDSADAILYADGGIVKDPLSACMLQGYAYEAWLRMAELRWVAGERAAAGPCLVRAHELKKRFNEAFWMPRHNYFAMALDHRQRQVSSIASDPGDALASGIIAAEYAPAVVERLFSEEMYSGWGVRTLSAKHPAFNPYSYHRGSVWPAENGVIAAGLRRYGFVAQLQQLIRAQLEIAERFQYGRLPEVFSGHRRDEQHPFPAIYPHANSPQAWSASAIVVLTQMLLGLYPYAPMQTLFVEPELPDWLPELTLKGLRVGAANLDIAFQRNPQGKTEYRVTRQEGKLRLIRQASPWSLFSGPMQRVEDLIDSLAA